MPHLHPLAPLGTSGPDNKFVLFVQISELHVSHSLPEKRSKIKKIIEYGGDS